MNCTCKIVNSLVVNAIFLFAIFAGYAGAQICTPAPADLLSWWPGDGNTYDIAGGYDGTSVNDVAFASGKVEESFSFDGGNFVSVPDDPIWTLGNEPFTIDLWVNFNRIQGRDPFIGHDERGNEFNKWIFWYDARGHDKPSGPALRFHINSPTLPPLDPVYAPWNPIPGQWYHVAVTRSGNLYTLYINGTQVATGTDSNFIPDPNTTVTIGRAEAYFFDGLIDEVEIFTRALSASEIQAIYDAGSAGKCKDTVEEVEIDIKPGIYPNSINLSSAGVIPVAILSSDTFNATTVIPDSVALAGASVKMVGKADKYLCHEEDVNSDGLLDLVCKVETALFMIEPGESVAVLEAETSEARRIRGEDSINIVPDN